MGLCFGGGPLGVGLASFAIGFLVLWGLKKVENELPRAQRGTLRASVAASGPTERELERELRSANFTPAGLAIALDPERNAPSTWTWKLKWHGRGHVVDLPPAIQQLARLSGVEHLEFSR